MMRGRWHGEDSQWPTRSSQTRSAETPCHNDELKNARVSHPVSHSLWASTISLQDSPPPRIRSARAERDFISVQGAHFIPLHTNEERREILMKASPTTEGDNLEMEKGISTLAKSMHIAKNSAFTETRDTTFVEEGEEVYQPRGPGGNRKKRGEEGGSRELRGTGYGLCFMLAV